MMHFIYEEGGVSVSMETDATSLYEDYSHGDGILGHFQRFLAAAGYTFDAEDELMLVKESEALVNREQFNDDMEELDELREQAKKYTNPETGKEETL